MTTTRKRSRFAAHINGMGQVASEVGGKATGLDLLMKHGYPVPATSVITTAAYEAAIAERSLRLLIDDLKSSPLPSPDLIPAESAAVERTFLAAPVPQEVTAAIAKLGSEFLRNGPVAVRSSATAEDLADASFAGQYLTITDVTGIEDLERAIRRCWASLWMPAARAYRRRQHISERHVAMAVIIQAMVDPVWSGVRLHARSAGSEPSCSESRRFPVSGKTLCRGR